MGSEPQPRWGRETHLRELASVNAGHSDTTGRAGGLTPLPQSKESRRCRDSVPYRVGRQAKLSYQAMASSSPAVEAPRGPSPRRGPAAARRHSAHRGFPRTPHPSWQRQRRTCWNPFPLGIPVRRLGTPPNADMVTGWPARHNCALILARASRNWAGRRNTPWSVCRIGLRENTRCQAWHRRQAKAVSRSPSATLPHALHLADAGYGLRTAEGRGRGSRPAPEARRISTDRGFWRCGGLHRRA